LAEVNTAHSVLGNGPQEAPINQRSTSFSFSLQIVAREGLSVRGDMTMQKTAVPQRASRPIQQTAPDIEDYDDQNLAHMPRSAVRFRASQSQAAPQGPNTGPIEVPTVTHRVSGSTRALLWFVLVLCVLFLMNGMVWPALVEIGTQLTYGNDRIASFDLDHHHFITQEVGGKVRLIVTSADGQHTQVLTTMISGAKDHMLVTLTQDHVQIDVNVNGVYVTSLVPDRHGMYTWKES